VLDGVKVTLILTLVGMTFAVFGAVLLAVMSLSNNWVLSGVAKLYIWLFRGTPLLVQLIFWAYMGVLYPTLGIGIPFTDITFFSARTSDLIGPMTAALLGLITHEASYSAEIVRSGILAVPHGQKEAGASLGMTPARTLRRIILPQAMRTIVPPLGNEFIAMLKYTSIIAVIGGNDLMTNVQNIYTQNYKVVPLLVVASIWYLVLVSFFSILQSRLERHYGRGVAGQNNTSFWGRLLPQTRMTWRQHANKR
jgi:polar amino acid transport system permease protein